MAGVFISYRRDDSSGYAGRSYDRFVSEFGDADVFMDIDSLQPGVDFVRELQGKISTCELFIAVIGQQWVTAKDQIGRSRLANPEDFVVVEISAALEQPHTIVVPVLVGGAQMPRSTELPECLAPLSRRHALILPDRGFQAVLGEFIQSVRETHEARIVVERAKAEQRAALAKAAAQKQAEVARLRKERKEAERKLVWERTGGMSHASRDGLKAKIAVSAVLACPICELRLPSHSMLRHYDKHIRKAQQNE